MNIARRFSWGWRVAAGLSGLTFAALAWGRFGDGPSFEDAIKQADLVAIVVPVENRPAKDRIRSRHTEGQEDDFVAIDTRFTIRAVLKGERPASGELTVLHFDYDLRPRSGRNLVIVNGAQFAQFVIGPVSLEVSDATKRRSGRGTHGFQPEWLAVLKRRADGRFEPVHDQYDSADSFRLLTSGNFLPRP